MSVKVCTFEGCGRPHYAKGFCNAHWQQLRKGHELAAITRAGSYQTDCAVDGCGRPSERRGWCQSHYKQVLAGAPISEIALKTAQSGKCCHPACDSLAATVGMCRRHARLISKYGMSLEQIVDLYSDPFCGICHTTDPGSRDFHVDHDHSCCAADATRMCGSCIRGLLCVRCNAGLGYFRDSQQILAAAIAYLDAA